MNPEAFGEVLSSRVRVQIVDALSVRPRTLGELSWITGISVQGVLRHLRRLMDLGVVAEAKLKAKAPKARRVYVAKSVGIGDYSSEGLTIVKATDRGSEEGPRSTGPQGVEAMAGEVLVLKRRVKDHARKLGRLIDELAEQQALLRRTLSALPSDEEKRLVLEVLLTEETVEDGEKVLSRFYGLGDRRSIDEALAQARQVVGRQKAGHGHKR